MVKVKNLGTADCVVGGFRYGTKKVVGSLLLGLYDEAGLLQHVGFTTGLAGPPPQKTSPVPVLYFDKASAGLPDEASEARERIGFDTARLD